VLLAFDILAALVYRACPGVVEAIGQLSLKGFARPGLFFWVLLIASIIVYIPSVLYFGAARWFGFGPAAIQASRVLLYVLYFFVGVGIGVVRFDQGLVAGEGALARRWPIWLAATIASYGCIIGLVYVRHNLLPDLDHLPSWWRVVYALALVSYSAAQTFNVLALFLRFSNEGSSILDPLRDNAYGIYLIHYIPVLWLQYALFGISFGPLMQLTAIIKAIIVFALTLAISWASTSALRRIPGVSGIL